MSEGAKQASTVTSGISGSAFGGASSVALLASAQYPSITGFEIVSKLGEGAMGEVFLAKHLESGGEVALKLMSPALNERKDLVQRFDREIRLLSGLKHPNIAGAVGQGVSNGRMFLAMEFVKGPTLANLLKVVGVFNEADVLRVALQVATALDYAWTTAGLVHRDIKPSNLLVIPDPLNQGGETVKIIDFGLARSTYTDDIGMTMTGMVMGTPNYMSPEQIRGEKDIGPHCDMYALGCTLYHLLTGRLPFDATAPGQMLAAHLHEPVPDPSRYVPSMASSTRHLVMTLMAKQVSQRFSDYKELLGSCEAALRTLNMRNTSAIRLLRRPMVLSKPRMVGTTPNADTITDDPFQQETNRLRRREKEIGATDATVISDYIPTTDAHPAITTIIKPKTTTARRARPGSATEALARVATEKIKRQKTTGVQRKTVQKLRGGSTTSPTVPAAGESLPIPELPQWERGVMPEEHAVSHEHNWVAWVIIGLAAIGLILATIFTSRI